MQKLSQIITAECIKVPLSAQDKYEAIEELIDVLVATGKIADKTPLLEAVLAREATRSTGIGQGLAIPHGKCAGLSALVGSAGKPAKPIAFESADGQPVNFIVLFGSAIEQTGPHIQALARLSRLMTGEDFRQRIAGAKTAKDIHRAFLDHEY